MANFEWFSRLISATSSHQSSDKNSEEKKLSCKVSQKLSFGVGPDSKV